MDYRLELLNEDTFENLINTICKDLFGIGIISFSKGKDGGRDGRFSGTAQNYPDKIKPWSGNFIIQSKHTINPVASCSNNEFKKIVDEEIVRIKKIMESENIDCYMLFTNRKYTGIKGEELLQKIKNETNIKNVVIIGKETINNNYLNSNKSIVRQYRLDIHHIPFDFSDQEIKDIIIALKKQLPEIKEDLKKQVEKLKYDYEKIKIEEKNKKNRLGVEYFENEILSKSLVDFNKLKQFIEDPKNYEFKEYYQDICAELSGIITVKRENFDSFEEIFVFIYKYICDGSMQLRGSKRHVLTLLHYMYFECLIGIK
jgi:hypothetical protein